MDLLLLGGTAWLGRAVATHALARGDAVTCLARGSADFPEGVSVIRADRDKPEGPERPDPYAAVRDRHWDLVIDLTREPSHAVGAARALADRAEHVAYVSSCSVYADQSVPACDESATLLAAYEGADENAQPGPADYGAAKVACELAWSSARDGDVLLARSLLIVGSGDVTDRFGYWPGRFALAAYDKGPVLVPERLDRPVQPIHVDDLAAWLVSAGERGETGPVNAGGPATPFAEYLDAAASWAGFTGERIPASDDQLVAAGVEEAMGPGSLALWIADAQWQGFSDRDVRRAHELGLRPRPFADTVADAGEWERRLGLARTGRGTGLDRDRELAVIDLVRG